MWFRLIRTGKPASPFPKDDFRAGIARLRERYTVTFDPSIFERDAYLAGDDERRLDELHRALTEDGVDAIVAARGGFGTTRLLDRLQVGDVRPRLLVGFSDLTALHALFARAGLRSLHASMVAALGRGTEDAMRQLGLPVADSWLDVGQQLEKSLLSYLPLRHFCYPLHEMMQLRPLLGLRSPVNTLARMINPLRAPSSIQSVFHPAYAALHQQTDAILGQPRALVFKGDSGEVEIKPQADTRLHLLWAGKTQELSLTRSLSQRVASAGFPSVEPLKALWRGSATNDYGLDATLATTAAALLVLQPELSLELARDEANELWQKRDKSRLS